jgi:hypothetical protein
MSQAAQTASHSNAKVKSDIRLRLGKSGAIARTQPALRA